jgi:hypothetical protein
MHILSLFLWYRDRQTFPFANHEKAHLLSLQKRQEIVPTTIFYQTHLHCLTLLQYNQMQIPQSSTSF